MPPQIPSGEEMGPMEGQSQGNLLWGIVNCLSAAPSWVEVCLTDLDNSFSTDFNLKKNLRKC
jgi:hypothetical protein